jgi:geranylgeranyl reductase family protein
MYQVIVIGAGPGGAYLAYLLARQGLEVLLLEKEHLPRHKPCGGGLTTKALAVLGDLELTPLIKDRVSRFEFTYCLGNPLVLNLDEPLVYTVERAEFDAFLVEKARAAGATVRENTRVDKVCQSGEQVMVKSGKHGWSAAIVAGADGAASVAARSLGLNTNPNYATTIEAHLSLSPTDMQPYRGTIKVDYGLVAGGYAWVFPREDHLSLGAGSFQRNRPGAHPRDGLKRLLEHENLAAIAQATPYKGWPIPIGSSDRDLHRDRVLLLGDAAGLADAFSGEGIHAALWSARLAAEVIGEQVNRSQPDLTDYSRGVQDSLGRQLTGSIYLSRIFYRYPGIINFVLPRYPDLATDFIKVAAGTITYEEFLEDHIRILGKLPRLRPSRFLSART